MFPDQPDNELEKPGNSLEVIPTQSVESADFSALTIPGTHLFLLLLDETGSMYSYSQDVVEAFNIMREKLQAMFEKQPGLDLKLARVHFNIPREDNTVVPFSSLSSFPRLDQEEYRPHNYTALHYYMLYGIDMLMREVSKNPDVVTGRVIVFTDGVNTFKRNTEKDVRERIKEIQAIPSEDPRIAQKYDVHIFFWGDDSSLGKILEMGIPLENVIILEKTADNITQSFHRATDTITDTVTGGGFSRKRNNTDNLD